MEAIVLEEASVGAALVPVLELELAFDIVIAAAVRLVPVDVFASRKAAVVIPASVLVSTIDEIVDDCSIVFTRELSSVNIVPAEDDNDSDSVVASLLIVTGPPRGRWSGFDTLSSTFFFIFVSIVLPLAAFPMTIPAMLFR